LSTLPLFVVHWGTVSRSISVTGVKPDGKILPPVEGSDIGDKKISSGTIPKLVGGSRQPVLRGSGKAKIIKPGGRLC